MTRHNVDRGGAATPVLAATRVVGAIIVPFLVVAWFILYLMPDRTEDLFAWPIGPPMTAMLLGSVYLGGAWFFIRVVTASQWEQVRLGFLPVAAFAAMMGVATTLHWDNFTQGSLSFVVWTTLYFTTPFIVLAVWIANERVSRHHGGTPLSQPSLPQRARRVAGALGVLAVVIALALFIWPEQLLEAWPWTLSPLTGRVVGATFVLGGAGIGIARWPEWRSVRLLVQVTWVMLGLITLAAVLARDDLDGGPLTWVFIAWLLFVLAGSAMLYRRMEATHIRQTREIS